MDRRSFLRSLGLFAGAVAIAPAIELPRVIYSFPTNIVIAPRNEFLDTQWVSKKALEILKRKLVISASFDREYYEWNQKLGSKLYVRTPRNPLIS